VLTPLSQKDFFLQGKPEFNVWKQKNHGKTWFLPRFTLSPEGVKRAVRQVSWLVFIAPPAFPGWFVPVAVESTPTHSGGTAPDLHRLPLL